MKLVPIVLAASFVALPLCAAAPGDDLFPSGRHFTLNVLGKEHVGSGTGGPNGHKLFVPLHGDCRIDLTEGDFAVTDADCVNDPRAGFQLPNPDPEDDGVSSYRIYVRVLGKPGGSGTFTTCREDGNDNYCSTENVYVARAGGRSPATDASEAMLTICHDRDNDGDYEREQLFDDQNADYYWNYANEGLRHVQLRFYPELPTPINGPCPPAA